MLNAADWTTRLNELAAGANVAGAVLGIWSGAQEILAAYGVLNATTQVPVTTDSVFQLGSITKLWTATMIMQLVDEGLLSLDTTVSEVLPGARLGTADVGGQVTVRHLLTHTSGIDGDDPASCRRGPSPLRQPGPRLGIAAQHRAGRADHRHARRPAYLRPPPSRRRHHRRRKAAAQRGGGDGDAVGVRRDPRVLRTRFGHRTGLATEPPAC